MEVITQPSLCVCNRLLLLSAASFPPLSLLLPLTFQTAVSLCRKRSSLSSFHGNGTKVIRAVSSEGLVTVLLMTLWCMCSLGNSGVNALNSEPATNYTPLTISQYLSSAMVLFCGRAIVLWCFRLQYVCS